VRAEVVKMIGECGVRTVYVAYEVAGGRTMKPVVGRIAAFWPSKGDDMRDAAKDGECDERGESRLV
jgi:hypothetical protein